MAVSLFDPIKLGAIDAANRIVETRSEPAGPQSGDPVILPLGAEL